MLMNVTQPMIKYLKCIQKLLKQTTKILCEGLSVLSNTNVTPLNKKVHCL